MKSLRQRNLLFKIKENIVFSILQFFMNVAFVYNLLIICNL